MNDNSEIMATLEEYANAYCAKDLARLMGLFVDGEDISLIGTGSDELCSGREAVASVFERNFADATATQFEWGWKDIAIHGQAAIVAIALKIHLKIGAENLVIPLRWTVSLIKADGLWKWVHRHASSAADSQAEGSAYPKGGK